MFLRIPSRLTSTLALCVALSSPLEARIIENPEDKTIQLLADFLSGNTPNFREEALNSYEYRRANEFDKPQVLTQIEEQLRSEFQGFADVEALKLRVRANIGEYDAASGVYRISVFEPGLYFPFDAGYRLELDNASAFHEWSLPTAEARQIRELSPRGNMVVELLVVPFGTMPNNQRSVRGQVVSMQMFEERTNRLVHEVALPDDQWKTIESASLAQIEPLSDDVLNLLGISPDMPIKAARSALEDAGFAVFDEIKGVLRFSTYEDNLNALMDVGMFEIFDLPYAESASGHMAPDLSCGDPSQVHSCGVVYFDEAEGTVESIAYLQNVVGTSKQDIVTSLTDKFGPQSDRFDAFLWQTFSVDQYVWGAFSESNDLNNHDFTEISGPKHWQAEAFIAEPTPQRKTLIVQINRIEGADAVTGGGGIKF